MHEDILAIGTLDEPIALGIIEPLHFSVLPHFHISFYKKGVINDPVDPAPT
jgi:hypothetical protein